MAEVYKSKSYGVGVLGSRGEEVSVDSVELGVTDIATHADSQSSAETNSSEVHLSGFQRLRTRMSVLE